MRKLDSITLKQWFLKWAVKDAVTALVILFFTMTVGQNGKVPN